MSIRWRQGDSLYYPSPLSRFTSRQAVDLFTIFQLRIDEMAEHNFVLEDKALVGFVTNSPRHTVDLSAVSPIHIPQPAASTLFGEQ